MTAITAEADRTTIAKPPALKVGRDRPRSSGPGGTELGKEATRQARRVAAMILEVLAGARTPTEAAGALELCVPRYYQLESRALRGLLAACEPSPKGRQPCAERELVNLRRDKDRLEREVLRQKALVRAAQRTIGLAPPAPPKKANKNHRQRRLARALTVAGRLQTDSEERTADAAAAAPA
jgi:hypothetical protein